MYFMKQIIIGRFGKIHGVKGWIRVISFTELQKDIIELQPWLIKKHESLQVVNIEESRILNDKILVKIKDINDCETARMYTNIDIIIEREQLPPLPAKQYYWADLEGLTVIDQSDKQLGIVDRLFATGSNDVIVVKNRDKEILIPYLKNVIVKIDLENKLIKVDYEI
jgi:16S rRNA processing protein RimM